MAKPLKTEEVNIHVPNEVIKELLTDSEWRMVKQRVMIIQYLNEGLSIRAVAEKAGVGTDTVVRIARKFEGSESLQKVFKKSANSSLPTAKWVFGQVSAKEE